MAENSSKAMASDAGKVTARPGREGQEDDAEGEKKVAIEKELRAQRSDKEQPAACKTFLRGAKVNKWSQCGKALVKVGC